VGTSPPARLALQNSVHGNRLSKTPFLASVDGQVLEVRSSLAPPHFAPITSHPPFPLPLAARSSGSFPTFPQIPRRRLLVPLQVHIGICAPGMPNHRPSNADKIGRNRPSYAVENSDFHWPFSPAPPECRTYPSANRPARPRHENDGPRRSRATRPSPYTMEGPVDTSTSILTIKKVAGILRCSKTHAQNVIEGKVRA